MNDYGVLSSLLHPIMKTIIKKGYNPDDFCSFAGVDRDILQDAEARIPEDELIRIMAAAAAFTKDDVFGLHQGQSMALSDLGAVGHVIQHSNTIGEAVSAFQKYNSVVCSGFQISPEAEGTSRVIRLAFQNPFKIPSRHCIEDMASSLYHIMMHLSLRPIPIQEIRFRHEFPGQLAPYLEVFGIEPKFGEQDNVLCLPQEVWDYPVVYADEKLRRIFERAAEEAMGKGNQKLGLSGKLYFWMMEALPVHFPTLSEAAGWLHMSPRTLQSRLKEEQTTYTDLANEVRRELALGYLGNTEYTAAEVAYLLHFSEPSAFQSAFRKWTGMTPGQYRTVQNSGAD
ncbi:AraC family transcriptional regulator [Paenibacillus caui]|uniref:AraC family transcriptional regulator n=1 Tax=Paenibacillus caui TaxID=2873927 RepID=UPI001CA9ACDD|nr:AraC family transcriptional regulator [Paenibacillus caui]